MDEAQKINRLFAAIILRLVRLFIRFGITYQTVNRMLRIAYVQVARKEMQANLSQTSVLTGIDRKFVRGIEEQQYIDQAKTPIFQIIGNWRIDDRFRNDSGEVIDLSEHELSELIARHITDVRPRSVINELLKQDAISLNENGDYVLNRREIGAESELEQISSISFDLCAMLDTMLHNVTSSNSGKLLQQTVYSTEHLEPRKALELLSELGSLGREAKSQANEFIMAKEQVGKRPSRRRVGFGVYIFDQPKN